MRPSPWGAIAAGVNVVAGYSRHPSTEILETMAKLATQGISMWVVGQREAALEVGAGAGLRGRQVLVTMKQVGLNVASDPLMSLAMWASRAAWSSSRRMIPDRSPRRPSRTPGTSLGFPNCRCSIPLSPRRPTP